MVSAFLSHSTKDKDFVRDLATFLESDGRIRVWLDERQISPGANIVGRNQNGLDADFVLLVLSPDSVQSGWVEEEYTDAFWEQVGTKKIKLVPILYRDCVIPRLLRNKAHIDARKNQLEGMRAVRTFLLGQDPAPPKKPNLLPVRPPLFVGREAEIAELRRCFQNPPAFVHLAEMPGVGKSTLALEFAYRHQDEFDGVFWLQCQGESLASISSELSRQLGLKFEGALDDVVRELKAACAAKRCLLILDHVEDESPGRLVPGGLASVLVTTRLTNLEFLNFRKTLRLPVFTEQECFDVFRRVLGEKDVTRHEEDCRNIFERVGRLPKAVTVAAALIKYDRHYSISGIAKDLPADVGALLRGAIAAADPVARKLLPAMAVCAAEGFGLDLAAEIAGLSEGSALDGLQHLVERSLVDELDRTDRRYRLHTLIRELAEDSSLRPRHAQAVYRRCEKWESNWRACERDSADFYLALDVGLRGGASGLDVERLGYYGWQLTRRIGRPAEAYEIGQRMAKFSEASGDRNWLQAWFGNQALILKDWGRLEEAMALHKKQEAIYLELGNQNSLQITYGNQALILKDWGRLEEAMALHKKEEAICLELGNRDSLQRSYGHQALILKDWGRFDEAMALHKKQEAICRELRNKDGLQRSYGNQARILRAWGQLDEAMALHKKQEAICLELGNKRSLGFCYWNWGLLNRVGNSVGEYEKLSAALAIFEELKMPRERDEVKAALANAKWPGKPQVGS